jgi:hypothetical protein
MRAQRSVSGGGLCGERAFNERFDPVVLDPLRNVRRQRRQTQSDASFGQRGVRKIRETVLLSYLNRSESDDESSDHGVTVA